MSLPLSHMDRKNRSVFNISKEEDKLFQSPDGWSCNSYESVRTGDSAGPPDSIQDEQEQDNPPAGEARILPWNLTLFFLFYLFVYSWSCRYAESIYMSKTSNNTANANDTILSPWNMKDILISETISVIWSCIVAFFLSSFTENWGYKVSLALCFSGEVVAAAGNDLAQRYLSPNMKFAHLILLRLMPGLFGGITLATSTVYATVPCDHPQKFFLLEAVARLGSALGFLPNVVIWHGYSESNIFNIASGKGNNGTNISEKVEGFLVPYNVVVVTITFVALACLCMGNRKEGNKANVRRLLLELRVDFAQTRLRCSEVALLLISAIILALNFRTLDSTGYEFANVLFGYKFDYYSLTKLVSEVLKAAAALGFCVLLLKCPVSDSATCVLGCCALMIQTAIRASAKKGYVVLYYLSYAADTFNGFSFVGIRILFCKKFPNRKCQMFAVLGICETVLPYIGSLLFERIYIVTLHDHSTMHWLIYAVIILLCVIPIFIFTCRWLNHRENDDLRNDNANHGAVLDRQPLLL